MPTPELVPGTVSMTEFVEGAFRPETREQAIRDYLSVETMMSGQTGELVVAVSAVYLEDENKPRRWVNHSKGFFYQFGILRTEGLVFSAVNGTCMVDAPGVKVIGTSPNTQPIEGLIISSSNVGQGLPSAFVTAREMVNDETRAKIVPREVTSQSTPRPVIELLIGLEASVSYLQRPYLAANKGGYHHRQFLDGLGALGIDIPAQ